MLKSSVRTYEVPVMEMEGWTLVNSINNVLFNQYKDSNKTKKGHFQKQEVMPYAKNKDKSMCR